MEIREFYEAIGGNYNDVFSRLMKDERILKYLGKFLEDNNLELMDKNLAENNYEEAFKNVHTLKGIVLNLGLEPISKTSKILCEEIRYGEPKNDISQMNKDLHEAYDLVTNKIKELINE